MNDCNCETSQEGRIDFALDDTYLVPTVNGIPGDGVDLSHAMSLSESQTHLSLDLNGNRLIYKNEETISSDGTPDIIQMSDLASVISLQELGNVSSNLISNGDILVYNETTAEWTAYTIPVGDVVSSLGVDANGNIVKTDSTGGGGSDGTIPIGGSMLWTGTPSNIPAGFVEMRGQEISRTVYANYFSLVGTQFGAGNGGTTFNVPPMGGRIPVGRVPSHPSYGASGQSGGEEKVLLGLDELPHHSHGVNDPGHRHSQTRDTVVTSSSGVNRTYLGGGSGQQLAWNGQFGMTTSGTGIWLNGTGGSAPHNNMQPYLVMMYIVRVI